MTNEIESDNQESEIVEYGGSESLRQTLKDIEIIRREISDAKFETIKWIAAIVLGAGAAQVFAIFGLLKLLGKI